MIYDRYGLIGHPIGHSRSPQLFEAAYGGRYGYDLIEAEQFSLALDRLDKVVLLDIYPAREEPLPGVSSELIFNGIHHAEKIMLKKDELLDYLRNEPVDVLCTFGAGDIDRLVEPIKEILLARK